MKKKIYKAKKFIVIFYIFYKRLLRIKMLNKKGEKLLVPVVSCTNRVSSQRVYLFLPTLLMSRKITQTRLGKNKLIIRES